MKWRCNRLEAPDSRQDTSLPGVNDGRDANDERAYALRDADADGSDAEQGLNYKSCDPHIAYFCSRSRSRFVILQQSSV